MLHFINNQIWKCLFGKPADGLEQSIEDEDEYRLLDKSPITNKYTNINCASFISGIIEGILISSKMFAKVTAHMDNEGQGGGSGVTGSGITDSVNHGGDNTSNVMIYVIKFDREVTFRDKNQ